MATSCFQLNDGSGRFTARYHVHVTASIIARQTIDLTKGSTLVSVQGYSILVLGNPVDKIT